MLFILLSLLVQSPKVELPATLNAKPGRLIQITARTEQKAVKWFLASSDADLIVMESTKSAIFSAMIPGDYRLIAYTAAGDVPSDPSICIVTVGNIAPIPANDPLAVALAVALENIWGALQEPDSKISKAALIATYRDGAALVDDPKIVDFGAFHAALLAARRKRLADDKLLTIRERISAEWQTLGDAPETLLTSEIRGKIRNIMARVVAALEKLS
jgi:hypothetical protein